VLFRALLKGGQNRRFSPNIVPRVLVDADPKSPMPPHCMSVPMELKDHRHRIPLPPVVGIAPMISEAAVVALSVMRRCSQLRGRRVASTSPRIADAVASRRQALVP
jgi:hypothetical protein